jgi:hypothetical protein
MQLLLSCRWSNLAQWNCARPLLIRQSGNTPRQQQSPPPPFDARHTQQVLLCSAGSRRQGRGVSHPQLTPVAPGKLKARLLAQQETFMKLVMQKV